MKNFIFSNYQGSFTKEFKTDHITGQSNFTVHDIKITGTPSEDDTIKAGLDFRMLPYSIEEFKAKATSGNFTLTEVDFSANTSTVHNTATNLSVTTAALDAGTNGVAEATVLTVPATSGATQGDYVIIYNKAGKAFAIWLDLNLNGTIPTGAIFQGADVFIKVPIVTGGSSIANAALAKTAIESNAEWTGFATIVDGGAGALTITNSSKGICTHTARHNAAEDGNGGFSFTKTDGSGDYSKQLVAAGGNSPVSWELDETSDDLVAGLSLSADGIISGVPTTTGTPSMVFKATDILGQTALSGSLTLTIS
jgi:hypothetical protein